MPASLFKIAFLFLSPCTDDSPVGMHAGCSERWICSFNLLDLSYCLEICGPLMWCSVTKGQRSHAIFNRFRSSEFLHFPLGGRVFSSCGVSLKRTWELWTKTLRKTVTKLFDYTCAYWQLCVDTISAESEDIYSLGKMQFVEHGLCIKHQLVVNYSFMNSNMNTY